MKKRSSLSQQLLIIVPLFIVVFSFIIAIESLFFSSEHWHGARAKYYERTLNAGRNAAVVSEEEFSYMGTSMLNSTFAPLGGLRFLEYKDGDIPYEITKELMIQSDKLARERRDHIKNSMKHAWKGYRDNSFGMDEVEPISGGGNNRLTGLGTTLVDSLDTLWLMDMKEEFYEARDWVRDKLRFDNSTELVSLFETTIRSLGGLLSAYDLSGDDIFLIKAKDLGSRLFKAFEKSPSGIPFPRVDLKTGKVSHTLWDQKYKRAMKTQVHHKRRTINDSTHTTHRNDHHKRRTVNDSTVDKKALDNIFPDIVKKEKVTEVRRRLNEVITEGSRAYPNTANSMKDRKAGVEKRKNGDIAGDSRAYSNTADKMKDKKVRVERGHNGDINRGNIQVRDRAATEKSPRKDGNTMATYLADAGTLQIEFKYLAKLSGISIYEKESMRAFNLMKSTEVLNGLFPSDIHVRGGALHIEANTSRKSHGRVTFGGTADSFYEYMLKLWLQGNKTDAVLREMYDKSIDAMHELLLDQSEPSGLWFIGDVHSDGTKFKDTMEHLTCFMGGLLALGAYTDPNGIDSLRAQRDLKTAQALTYTCYQMYASSPTGLSPESVQDLKSRKINHDFLPSPRGKFYLLRPETVESLYILNFLTGDPIYREWAWEIFEAIETFCKTSIAYAQFEDVTNPTKEPKDSMESFFPAETLKYLYLIFDPESEVDILTKHVFNTEAHPLRFIDDQ